jgi:uncharacterized C2H2 Zn-finger protein
MPPFDCPTCGATFPTEAALTAHAAVHMGAPGATPGAFSCAACGARFPSQAALKEHSSKAHRM